MIVVNFFGEGCTGKSTASAMLYARLKQAGIKVEYVREHCKTWYYEGTLYKLDNQFLITGRQIEQTELYRKGGCDVVVTDSPILLGAIYSTVGKRYNTALADAIRKAHFDNNNYNVFLERDFDFNDFARGSEPNSSVSTDGKPSVAEQVKTALSMESMTRHHVFKSSQIDFDLLVEDISWALNGTRPASTLPAEKKEVAEEKEANLCSHPSVTGDYYAEDMTWRYECAWCGAKAEQERFERISGEALQWKS